MKPPPGGPSGALPPAPVVPSSIRATSLKSPRPVKSALLHFKPATPPTGWSRSPRGGVGGVLVLNVCGSHIFRGGFKVGEPTLSRPRPGLGPRPHGHTPTGRPKVGVPTFTPPASPVKYRIIRYLVSRPLRPTTGGWGTLTLIVTVGPRAVQGLPGAPYGPSTPKPGVGGGKMLRPPYKRHRAGYRAYFYPGSDPHFPSTYRHDSASTSSSNLKIPSGLPLPG